MGYKPVAPYGARSAFQNEWQICERWYAGLVMQPLEHVDAPSFSMLSNVRQAPNLRKRLQWSHVGLSPKRSLARLLGVR